MTLLRVAGPPGNARSCLGFVKRLDEPNLQISGWTCQADCLPARRTRDLLYSEPADSAHGWKRSKLAELFAHAELKRGSCIASAASADWVTGAEIPGLRGAFWPGWPRRPAKMLVSMQVFRVPAHYCDAVWPD